VIVNIYQRKQKRIIKTQVKPTELLIAIYQQELF